MLSRTRASLPCDRPPLQSCAPRECVRAARLAGAAQALYAKYGRKLLEDSSLDTLLPGWLDRPDRGVISTAFDAGKSLNAEQAAAYALSDTDV